jgi:hypothetical protein
MRSRIARNLEWLFTPQVSSGAPKAMFAAAGERAFSLPSGFSGHDYAVPSHLPSHLFVPLRTA